LKVSSDLLRYTLFDVSIKTLTRVFQSLEK